MQRSVELNDLSGDICRLTCPRIWEQNGNRIINVRDKSGYGT